MPATGSQSRSWTYAGLALAFLGLPAVVFAYRQIAANPAAGGSVAIREIAILALVALLFWIVVSREKLPLTSIGLRWDGLGRSLAWGLALALMCAAGLAACLAAFHVLGVSYGQGGGGGAISVSLWATSLTVVRAGIAEEVFYRGYAIERIEALTGSRWMAALIPLVPFAAFHYRQGFAGIAIAFFLGAILTGFYLWKRNLVANIFAHFLVDFVPNVLLPLLGGE
jgi:membrane protease YdiL (CAAX protease family)